jgi:hypothetical protein
MCKMKNVITRIQCKGYVRPLQELNVEFQIFKEADNFIIDELSMMTSILL